MRAVVAAILVLVVAGCASAPRQQMESYCCSPQPASELGVDTGYEQPAEPGPPEGLALPQFTGDKPLFFRWTLGKDLPASLKVKDGIVWIALDSSVKDGPYDRLYIDANCDGSLADEQANPADAGTRKGRARFSLVEALLPGDRKPTPYHLNLQLNDSTKGNQLHVESACWNEGKVRIAGKEYRCVLIDGTANGQFNDISPDPYNGDAMRFGPADAASSRGELYATGRYMEVQGAYYALQVAPDGSSVAFTPARHIPSGSLNVPPDMTELSLAGPHGHFYCKPVAGRVTVPTGSYTVFRWAMERPDEGGRKWTLTGYGRQGAPTVQVETGKEIALDVGEPVISHVGVSKEGDDYIFTCRVPLKGRMGETVSLAVEKGGCADPELRITNANGTYKQEVTLATGFS